MKKWKKYVFLTHRYLGILLAPLILLWSISGLVMMYVSYPALTESKRLQLLPNIDKFSCCSPSFFEELRHLEFVDFSLEHLEGGVVARVKTTANEYLTFEISKNRWLSPISEERARRIFEDNFLENSLEDLVPNGEENKPFSIEKIERDQWTVYSKYNKHRPLYKVVLNDRDGQEVYISSITGEVVQHTTSFQRNWSWIGAVTHWLYPTALRQYTKLWYWLVVGLSIVSLLAVMSGVWIGLKQLKKRKNKPLSPYKGMRLLHHWGGVFIALFLFLFLLSGLLSMSPWGVFKSPHYPTKEALGKQVETHAVLDSLQYYLASKFDSELVQLSLSAWNNQVYWLAIYRSGEVVRYDKHFNEQALLQDELVAAGIALGGPEVSQQLLSVEDDYYFAHKKRIELPVWKITTNNLSTAEVLFYVSPVTGEVIKTVDSKKRLYRWLFNALHRWDFSPTARQRPIWDFLLVPFMALLILFSLTGCYLGWQRLRRS